MPLVYDIEKDIRYQQGEEKGEEKRNYEISKILLSKGLDFDFVQEVTGVSKSKLTEIAGREKSKATNGNS